MPSRPNITATKPRRFLTYILSLLGLDGIAFTRQHDVSCFSSSSGSSILTDSTLLVSHDDYLDEKGSIGGWVYSDPWALQTWIGGLPKVVLCHILSATAMQYPKICQVIEEHQGGMNVPWMVTTTGLGNDMAREISTIQARARQIVHDLDHLRPSEQFARAVEVSEDLHRLVRLTSNTLHAPTHGHSLVALLGLLVIVLEGLKAPPEVRQHVFYHAKLGRIVILEMASVLKNYKDSVLPPSQWSLMLSVFEKNCHWLEQLEEACAKMARYDVTWDFRQEYEDVVTIAARYCGSCNL
ncbi:hypothetical protein DFQ28_011326 [Apophysomyces sp. BC1034]|nr:hypothetical protein DFQ30_005764 [Apophysomyces sp. BC1015]KAG0181186.1 hypothetical protein DFQ29_009057 [Apophysomyces sp. BC1021]KAG0191644.1 hypothetical protein DFQ28_011326 [Apophysomyces sp. BC1034]